MPITNYQSLCTDYYELDKPDAPKNALDFYMRLVKETEGSILEPMCGTGRFLLPMIQAGYRIEGYDASPHMLAMLRRKAKALQLNPDVWQQLTEEKHPATHYDLIFIPSGSFGLVVDDNAIHQSLANFYQQLNKKGKLVFEVETIASIPTYRNSWQGNVRYYSDNHFILLHTLHLPQENDIITIICRYELIKSGKIVKTEIEKIAIRLYTPAQMMHKLKTVGFTNIQQHKAYHYGKMPDNKDEVIVFECTK